MAARRRAHAAFREEARAGPAAARAPWSRRRCCSRRAWTPLYDATIAIVAPEQLRAERAAARGHAALAERTARQLPQEEKAARATYAVVNDGSLELLERGLSEVLVKLRR